MRRRAAVALTLALAGAVALAPPSGAITGGRVDGRVHPYVGALFFPGTAFPICSGVLVPSAARGVVLLTVAHCLVPYTDRRRVTVTFAPVVDSAPRLTGTYVPDPAYHPGAPDPHDLAVVVFDDPPFGRQRARLAPVGSVAPRLPARLSSVGYGFAPGGVRKRAQEIATGIDGPWLRLAPGTGNSCDVDSGGPDLMGTRADPVVAALTDEGPCFGAGSFDKDYRVDTAAAHYFVDHV